MPKKFCHQNLQVQNLLLKFYFFNSFRPGPGLPCFFYLVVLSTEQPWEGFQKNGLCLWPWILNLEIRAGKDQLTHTQAGLVSYFLGVTWYLFQNQYTFAVQKPKTQIHVDGIKKTIHFISQCVLSTLNMQKYGPWRFAWIWRCMPCILCMVKGRMLGTCFQW